MAEKVIHLVEPDEGDFRGLRAVLDGLGYEVVATVDAEAALQAFPTLAPDLVLTAYPLPTASGEDFADQVKRISPATPVIGIIRRGMREVARDALTHGCDDFVTKPVDPQLLEEKVRRLLSTPDELPPQDLAPQDQPPHDLPPHDLPPQVQPPQDPPPLDLPPISQQ